MAAGQELTDYEALYLMGYPDQPIKPWWDVNVLLNVAFRMARSRGRDGEADREITRGDCLKALAALAALAIIARGLAWAVPHASGSFGTGSPPSNWTYHVRTPLHDLAVSFASIAENLGHMALRTDEPGAHSLARYTHAMMDAFINVHPESYPQDAEPSPDDPAG